MPMVEYLLSKGTDASINSCTAVINACHYGFLDIVKVLLDSIEPGVVDSDGYKMLYTIADKNSHEPVSSYIGKLMEELGAESED